MGIVTQYSANLSTVDSLTVLPANQPQADPPPITRLVDDGSKGAAKSGNMSLVLLGAAVIAYFLFME